MHSVDGCGFASPLCNYGLRKGDLIVLSWTRVRRVRQGSVYNTSTHEPSRCLTRNNQAIYTAMTVI